MGQAELFVGKGDGTIEVALPCPHGGICPWKVMTTCEVWARMSSGAAISTFSRVVEGTCAWAANLAVETNDNGNNPLTATSFQYGCLLSIRAAVETKRFLLQELA